MLRTACALVACRVKDEDVLGRCFYESDGNLKVSHGIFVIWDELNPAVSRHASPFLDGSDVSVRSSRYPGWLLR